MKKIYLLLVMAICLSGCGNTQNIEQNRSLEEPAIEEIETVNNESISDDALNANTKKKLDDSNRSPLGNMTMAEIKEYQKTL